jgi:single-stranded DNA-specific DHH superfamily exonuclease
MASEGPALFDQQDMDADVLAANQLLAAFGRATEELGGVPVSVVYVFISAVLERLRSTGDTDLGAQMQLLGALADMVYTETAH